jgi:hypothetical protein
MKTYFLILISISLFILGCATIPLFNDRASVAQGIAAKAGLTKEYIKAGRFTLMSYHRLDKRSESISIYIEGDGRAWESKYMLSDDPTPLNPVALRLAAQDPAGNVVYIARPGQYPFSGIPDCDSRYWSGSRFAQEVINSFSQAIDLLKEKSLARHVELIGYSGGGAIAVLLAARRRDVTALRTVAGNLDPQAFCEYHHVSQLEGSMDPMNVAREISLIPQRHFAGSKDSIVPVFITRYFIKQLGDKSDDRITIVQGASHSKEWQQRWKELLSLPLL